MVPEATKNDKSKETEGLKIKTIIITNTKTVRIVQVYVGCVCIV